MRITVKNMVKQACAICLACLLILSGVLTVTAQAAEVTTTVQKAIWPFIGEVHINQLSSGIYDGRWVSHGIADMFAIDVNAAGAVAYAPFDCRVVDILPDWGNIAVIESVAPVYLADGSMDYVHVAFVHDDNIDNLIAAYNTGSVIAQWTPIYDEGTTAGNGWTVGRHIHIEARRGRYENYKGTGGTVSYAGRPTGFSMGNCGEYANIVYLAGNTSISDPKNIFFAATGYGTYFNCSAVNDWEGEVDNGYFQYWKHTDSFTQEITTTAPTPHWHGGSWVNDGTLTENDVQVEHRFYYPENTALGFSGCFMGTDANVVQNATPESHNGVWMVSEDASGWSSSDAGDGMRYSRIYYSAQGDPASALGFGQTLLPGTTYYYKFFITWQGNGQVYTSDVSNFTTTGTAAIKPETLTYSVLTYNAEDNAAYFLYPAQANNVEIRKEILAGEPNAAYVAVKSAAVLHSDGKRYQQTFTFSNVLAGEYKLVTYKPGYGVRVRDVSTDTGDLDAIEMAPSGDITGEGKVNAGDLQKLFQHINKKISLEQEYIPSADVNGDGKVNAGDLQRLFQFINKRIDQLE